MSGTNKKSKLSLLLAASLVTANFVCAGDAYKNNVVDVRVNKESGNSVKVTIYTDKPYTDPVVVNKKANNKYVILMPETKSSLKSAPTVTNGTGTVSNVSVNTQDVSGGKGYTKIIITSEKAINVVPRTQQMAGAKVVEKPSTTVTKLNTSAPVNVSKTTTPAKTTQTKPKQEVKTTTAQKPAQAKPKTTVTKPVPKPSPAAPKVAQAPVQQVQPKPVAPVAQPKPVAQTQPEPIDVLKKEIKTGQNASLDKIENDAVLNKEIAENIADNKVENKTSAEEAKKKNVMDNIRAVLDGFKYLSLWKLLLLAGAITLPVIVIMIILILDKKINKKIDLSFKRKEEEDAEYTEPIPQPAPAPTVAPSGEQTYNSFDEMLNQVEEPVPSFHEEQLQQSQYERFKESIDTPIEEPVVPNVVEPEIVNDKEFNNDFVDTDFENDINSELENVVEDIQQVQNVETPQEVAEPPAVPEPEEPQNLEPYNPDGYLADFSSVDDKAFFDELVIQTMADNNAKGLPEESPADEIFNFMTEDSEPELIEPTIEEETPAVVEEPVAETPAEEDTQSVHQEDDGLTMLTEAKINDNAGLYLVNYEDFSSLVGYIKDDYFVIKKFDDVVNSRIILKQTEKLKNATRYLVRVGRNKMVVEVSDTSMSRLLDL